MIEREYRDDVVILRMMHGKANALDSELLREVRQALTEELQAPAKAMVLTGRDGMFSAGVDLFRILDGGVDYLADFLPALDAVLETLFFFPKPVVAAVNGHAIAGGAVLACAADRRLMTDGKGRIGVPELLVGVPFPARALETLRFALPPNVLQEAIYGGVTYRSDEALAKGFIDQVVPAADLLDEAVRVARELAAIPPRTFRATKSHVRQSVRDFLAAHGEAIDTEVVEVWASQEIQDVIRAYVDKTLKG